MRTFRAFSNVSITSCKSFLALRWKAMISLLNRSHKADKYRFFCLYGIHVISVTHFSFGGLYGALCFKHYQKLHELPFGHKTFSSFGSELVSPFVSLNDKPFYGLRVYHTSSSTKFAFVDILRRQVSVDALLILLRIDPPVV